MQARLFGKIQYLLLLEVVVLHESSTPYIPITQGQRRQTLSAQWHPSGDNLSHCVLIFGLHARSPSSRECNKKLCPWNTRYIARGMIYRDFTRPRSEWSPDANQTSRETSGMDMVSYFYTLEAIPTPFPHRIYKLYPTPLYCAKDATPVESSTALSERWNPENIWQQAAAGPRPAGVGPAVAIRQ